MKINAEAMHMLTTHHAIVTEGKTLSLEGPYLRVGCEGGDVVLYPLTTVLDTVVGLSYQSKMYLVDNCPLSAVVKLFGLPIHASKQELYIACCAA